MKNILLTGAGGFIGFHLANFLSDLGHEVRGVDIHSPTGSGNKMEFSFTVGDFRDPELMNVLLKDTEVVFHLASAHLQISLEKKDYWDINVHSLKPFLELCQKMGVQKFIHTSSVGVYGELKDIPANEESECFPQSIYGETKLAGEAEVLKYFKNTGFPVVILRPAWVYGSGCPRTEKIYHTLRKKRFVQIGKMENLRHPIYIDDMLEAYRLAMENDDAVGELFVIGGEHAITTSELIDTFSRVFNISGPVLKIPHAIGIAMAISAELVFGIFKMEPPISKRTLEFFNTHTAFDISKAKKLLKFNPSFTFEEGLNDYYSRYFEKKNYTIEYSK